MVRQSWKSRPKPQWPSRGRACHFKSAGSCLNTLNNSYDRMYLWARSDGYQHLMTAPPVATVAVHKQRHEVEAVIREVAPVQQDRGLQRLLRHLGFERIVASEKRQRIC